MVAGKKTRQYRVWYIRNKKWGVGDWIVSATSGSNAITTVRERGIALKYWNRKTIPKRSQFGAKLDKR